MNRKSLRELIEEIRLKQAPPFRITATNLPPACLSKLALWHGLPPGAKRLKEPRASAPVRSSPSSNE